LRCIIILECSSLSEGKLLVKHHVEVGMSMCKQVSERTEKDIEKEMLSELTYCFRQRFAHSGFSRNGVLGDN
jgi:CxxC motif-containing protein